MSESPSKIIQLRLRSSNLLQALFKSEMPESTIREIPAQSLHIAISQCGLPSAIDTLNICSQKQLRLLLDFDCWERDRFSEEQFWEWLSLSDEENGLDLLVKVLKSVDLKLVGLLVARHITWITNEEPTENPPEPGFYTPDKGYTWLRVNLENELHHFLLTRFLAVIFETSAEVFYQILSIPSVSTPSMLEEEAFQERNARLSEEGIPDLELASEFQSPLTPAQIHEKVASRTSGRVVEQIPVVTPLLYDGGLTRQLARLLETSSDPYAVEAELTLLMNTALVFWGVSAHDSAKYALLCEQVKGACEIGLEELSSRGLSETVGDSLNLSDAYRLGLHLLFELRTTARKIDREGVAKVLHEKSTISLLAGLREPFPCVPDWFNSTVKSYEMMCQNSENGLTAHPTQFRALSDLADLRVAVKRLEEIRQRAS